MRLIDADRFKAYMQDKYLLFDHTLADIDAQPTVDAVKVVRCKDCKWREKLGCIVWIVDESDKPKDDDFCSWGERKESGKTD